MDLRDFIYLDFPLLRSFASQLFEGVPESRTHSASGQTDLAGEIRGRLPIVIEGTASTKAILSAGSSVTATVHHQLVDDLISALREQKFLWEPAEAGDAPDGSFVLLSGQIQVSDPESLRATIEQWPDLWRHLQALSPNPDPAPTKADRRANRGSASPNPLPKPKADATAGMLKSFLGTTVRLRLISGGVPVATAVVERGKFVEDLDHLVRRHGYLTSGEWETLAQVNSQPGQDFYAPNGSTMMDVIERDMLGPMKILADVSGTAADTLGLRITPLAIYRVIRPRT